jgi:NADH:ubiquinone oxidoreductase subunit F (NADH-binding)
MSRDLPTLRLDELTDLLERNNLRGRGGASFPTATKLRAVAAGKRRPIVVVNAAEGEPLSHKDRYLLTAHPDTILDGALAAAYAIRADQIVIAVEETMRPERRSITEAASRRQQLIRRRIGIDVQAVPSGYVTGQETALISALSGREAKPTLTPPYPSEVGLRGRRTLVSNTETYSHIGQIVRGTYDGTRLVSVGGAIANPGLVEILPGTTLDGVCSVVGGLTEPVHGVLTGGYGGTWATLDDLYALPLSEHALRNSRLTLGAGIVYLMPESACPVAEVASVVQWMAGQSAGQCGPCVHGLRSIAGALDELTRDGAIVRDRAQIARWTQMIQRRGACAHPDGVARFVTTAMHVFARQFEEHTRRGPCRRCATTRVLPIPPPRRHASGTTRRSKQTPDPGAWSLAAAR